jgi:putative hemolysin
MNEFVVNGVLVFVFILIGGVFAAAELALVSLRESQLGAIEKRGWRGAAVAKLARDPNKFLGAVQLGVTVAGFTSAAFGATALSPLISDPLESAGVGAEAAAVIGVVVMTLLIAYLSLVFGELAPKRLALQRAEGFSLITAPIIAGLAVIFRPVIWVIGASSDIVVRIAGGDPNKTSEGLSGEELASIVETHEGLAPDQREILADVLESSENSLKSVLRHRADVVCLKQSLSIDEARKIARDLPHSRYPVITKNLDDCESFVHIRDLMWQTRDGQTIADIARPIPMLPRSMGVLPAIAELKAEGKHIALVVDEHGGTDGLVTLEDLIEELIGEVYDEHDSRLPLEHSELRGSTRLPGDMSLRKFAELADIDLAGESVTTLGGLVMNTLGRVPLKGDRIDIGSLSIVVSEVSRRRVVTVTVVENSTGSA